MKDRLAQQGRARFALALGLSIVLVACPEQPDVASQPGNAANGNESTTSEGIMTTRSGLEYEATATAIADYTTPTPQSLSELLRKSDIVVRVRPTELHSIVGEGRLPTTQQTFSVLETVGGRAPDEVVVLINGGIVASDTDEIVFQEVIDEPQFDAGSEYLLILEAETGGIYRVAGRSVGRYRIGPDERLLSAAEDLELVPAPQAMIDAVAGIGLAGRSFEDAVTALRRVAEGAAQDR